MKTILADFICYLEDGGQYFDPELKKEYLEKEKQQIIDAYNGFDHDMTAEKYYSETFKND